MDLIPSVVGAEGCVVSGDGGIYLELMSLPPFLWLGQQATSCYSHSRLKYRQPLGLEGGCGRLKRRLRTGSPFFGASMGFTMD